MRTLELAPRVTDGIFDPGNRATMLPDLTSFVSRYRSVLGRAVLSEGVPVTVTDTKVFGVLTELSSSGDCGITDTSASADDTHIRAATQTAIEWLRPSLVEVRDRRIACATALLKVIMFDCSSTPDVPSRVRDTACDVSLQRTQRSRELSCRATAMQKAFNLSQGQATSAALWGGTAELIDDCLSVLLQGHNAKALTTLGNELLAIATEMPDGVAKLAALATIRLEIAPEPMGKSVVDLLVTTNTSRELLQKLDIIAGSPIGAKLKGYGLGLALQFGNADELKAKLDIIEGSPTGAKLKGQALGLALQRGGNADELKAKLDIIAGSPTGAKLKGQALGLALQCGSADELKAKLDIIAGSSLESELKGTSLGFALQFGSAAELKAKLDIIAGSPTGAKLKGQALGLALQCGSAAELKAKLDIIAGSPTGAKLKGQALGLALQCGSADELKAKLDIIAGSPTGAKLKGQALGFALQFGSADELKAKLDIIAGSSLESELKGTSLGFALQFGSADELKAKLDIIAGSSLESELKGTSLGFALQCGSAAELEAKLDIIEASSLTDELKGKTLGRILGFKADRLTQIIQDIASIQKILNTTPSLHVRVYMHNLLRWIAHVESTEQKQKESLKRLTQFDYSRFEITYMSMSQSKGFNPREILDACFEGTDLNWQERSIVLSLLTGLAQIGQKQLDSLRRVFWGGETGRASALPRQREDGSTVDQFNSPAFASYDVEPEYVDWPDRIRKWFGTRNLTLNDAGVAYMCEVLKKVQDGIEDDGNFVEEKLDIGEKTLGSAQELFNKCKELYG